MSLGFFGIGGYTYPNTSTGFKGFFVAGNELSALFILFTILIYGRLIGEDRGFISSIFILFSIFISILIGTKSSVLLLTLTMFIYPLYAKLINREYFSTLKVSLILFVPISAFALFFYHFGENVQSISTIERIIYKLDSHHIINAIFSGREIWFEMYMNYLYEHGLVSSVYFSVIFGSGFYYSTKATLGKQLIESDLLDLYTLSGVIGVFIVVSISIYFAYIILSSKKNGKIWKEALYVHLALTLIAIFFGHVWTSGMLSVAYASMIGFTFSQRVVKC
ncbi:hypothetical protein [Vibrio sp. YYF0003]|uniref:hypothetical protein n=1 Tax=Vibrio sp. YYF0003 TaxID=3116646 RepID=UPI003FCCBCA2